MCEVPLEIKASASDLVTLKSSSLLPQNKEPLPLNVNMKKKIIHVKKFKHGSQNQDLKWIPGHNYLTHEFGE